MTGQWPRVQAELEAMSSGRRGSRTARRLRALVRTPLPPGVYILVYHSVVDPERAEPWERAYERVATSADAFGQHVAFLAARAEPLPLERAPALLAAGPPTRAYYSLTFDDGYANLVGAAAEVCAQHGVEPTAFVGAGFAAGRVVYHRVLLAQLLAAGEAASVAAALNRHVGDEPFDAADLVSQTKDRYAAGRTEAALLDAWGDRQLPRAHLGFEDLRELRRRGWRIGNHTLTHATLRGLDAARLDSEILGNQKELERERLEPLTWLAYPNGTAASVGPSVGAWLAAHEGWHGAHGNGGVNLALRRDEWLRIPVGELDVRELELLLRTEAARTRAAYRKLEGSD